MTRYDQRAMCNHLVNCLEVLEIMEFPTTEKRVALVIVPVLSETLQIDCTRQLPDDKAMSSVTNALNGNIQLAVTFLGL